jgi:hypothetical protein
MWCFFASSLLQKSRMRIQKINTTENGDKNQVIVVVGDAAVVLI